MINDFLKNGRAIDVSSAIEMTEFAEQKAVFKLYREAVEDIKEILRDPRKPLIHIALSWGKDSLCVLVSALQAYRELIEQGEMEPERPLAVCTVDTGVESIPMIMFTRHSSPQLKRYAERLNINLTYEVAKPRLIDQFFVRWASAQKLIPNPKRSGDCTNILKIDVATRFINNFIETLEPEYQASPIITLLGSRDAVTS